MTKSNVSAYRVTLFFSIVATQLMCGCSGFRGHVFERDVEGQAGGKIPGVEIGFSKENSEYTRQANTNLNGWYQRKLRWGRYRVTANHLAYEPYDSTPTFFRVPWIGQKTLNIFLERLDATIIIMARHAEKASSAINTNLDPDPGNAGVGVSRAQLLSSIAAISGVSTIYVTEWCRTAQTGQPSAQQLGLTMNILRANHPNAGLKNCNPPITISTQLLPTQITNSSELAQHVLANHTGEVVFIAGHSNTVPQLVEAFGAPSVCPVYLPLGGGNSCVIPEDEFSHLFIVTVPSGGGPASVNHDTYGVQ